MMTRGIVVAVLATALFACVPEVQQAVVGTLPAQRGEECRANCAALGMQLTSVVLIMNSTGCVCQVLDLPRPPGAPAPSASSGPAASALVGGAAIAVTAAAAQQQHQQQRRDTTSIPRH